MAYEHLSTQEHIDLVRLRLLRRQHAAGRADMSTDDVAKLAELEYRMIGVIPGELLDRLDRDPISGPPVTATPLILPDTTEKTALTAEEESAFWSARPFLEEIWHRAWQEDISPWGLLGVWMSHHLARIGPHVMLPPKSGIIENGGLGSLNLWVALVGESAAGKGDCLSIGKTMHRPSYLGDDPPVIDVQEAASGQGIEACYSKAIKARTLQYCDTMIFVVPEVDSLAASAGAVGSIAMPTLRKMWSGEAIGAAYAGEDKRRRTGDHRYRSVVILGVQPRRAEPLLNAKETDGGTPQRITMLPAVDQHLLRLKDDGWEPPPRAWDGDYTHDWKMTYGDPITPIGRVDLDGAGGDEPQPIGFKPQIILEVAEDIRQDILQRNRRSKRKLGRPNDGHSAYNQLKWAAGFAISRTGGWDGAFALQPTDIPKIESGWLSDWWLAECVIRVSQHTIDATRAEMRTGRDDALRETGRDRKIVELAQDDSTHDLLDERAETVAEIASRAALWLAAHPETWYTTRQMMRNSEIMKSTQAGLWSEVEHRLWWAVRIERTHKITGGKTRPEFRYTETQDDTDREIEKRRAASA